MGSTWGSLGNYWKTNDSCKSNDDPRCGMTRKKIIDWGYWKTIENHRKNNISGWRQEQDKGQTNGDEARQKKDNRPRLLRNLGKRLQNQYLLADGKKI